MRIGSESVGRTLLAWLACVASARADELPESGLDLGRGWSLDGAVELDYILERNFDLSPDATDVATLEPQLEVRLAYEPESGPRFYAEGRVSHAIFLRDDEGSGDPETRAELRQAYVVVDAPESGLSLQVGRQRFEDERGWWYDEDLDAARLLYVADRTSLELSFSRSASVGSDVLGRKRAGRGENLMLVGRLGRAETAQIGAYLIAQDRGSDPPERPVFLGIGATGDAGTHFTYHVDAAIARGTDEGRDIRAYGFDAGVEVAWESGPPASLVLGVAFGSGDRDPLDGTDTEFRQTGLQGSYFDYGEVLAPELSNLWVASAGVELWPASDTSLRVVYHRYRQHHATATLRNVLIERDPDGRSRNLGHALDVSVSHEAQDGFYVELIAGAFNPGAAFGPGAPLAYFGQITLSYGF